MERDNQKEKKIDIEQAKDIVKDFWKKATADGLLYVWFGEDIEEFRGGYLIPAMILDKDDPPPASCIRAWVDYTRRDRHDV